MPGADDARATVIVRALRARLHDEGLHVVLPLPARSFDEVCAVQGGPRAREWLPEAGGAVLIGDGGPRFFARFRAATGRTASPEPTNPLDDFTRRQVESAMAAILAAEGIPHRVLYPFGDGAAALPFQRLGQAAGLPDPGPLGIQIHPEFGPWWAYRAIVIVSLTLEAEPRLAAACPPCDRFCVLGCPTHAPARRAPSDDEGTPAGAICGDACGARLRCPEGSAHRYSPEQLAFHGRARDALLRAHAVKGQRNPA